MRRIRPNGALGFRCAGTAQIARLLQVDLEPLHHPIAAVFFTRLLVAIETDATRYYGPKAMRPGLLGPTDSETLLAHIATDLKSLVPDISNCSLITAGALFTKPRC